MASVVSKKKGRCPCCSYESNNETEFLDHLKIHRREKNFKVPCLFCVQSLQDFKTYNQHKNNCVGRKRISQEEKSEKKLLSYLLWDCELCPTKIRINSEQDSSDFEKIKTHLYLHSRAKEIVICPFCSRQCNNYKYLSKHISEHRDFGKFSVESNIIIENTEANFSESDNEHMPSSINSDNEQQSLLIKDSELENEIQQDTTSFVPPKEQAIKSHSDISQLNSVIKKNECDFALKLSSKCHLPQEVVNDVFSFCQEIHDLKMEFISAKLQKTYYEKTDVKIDDIIETTELLDNVAGSGENLMTHYKREKLLRTQYNFIEPKVTRICCIVKIQGISYCHVGYEILNIQNLLEFIKERLSNSL